MHTPQQKLDFKQQAKTVCLNILNERIATIVEAINSAQEAANSEEKSSAGDKYETGRAMGHLAQEMQSVQLEEAKTSLDSLQAINVEQLYNRVTAGTVVTCKDFIFFISIGLGAIQVNEQKVMALSPKAPLAILMNQKTVGESFIWNGKSVEIVDVW